MAALPESLDLSPSAGTAPSTASVRPTDFGLGEAAAQAGQVGELQYRVDRAKQQAQMRADQQTIQPYVMQAREAAAAQMSTDAATWNGTPGFGLDQFKKAQARNEVISDSAGDSLTPDQQALLSHSLSTEASNAGMTAVQHEQGVFQQQTAEAAATRQATALTAFQTSWAPAQQGLIDGYDGSQPGKLVGDLNTAFDAASAPVLAGASPIDKPALTARLAEMKTETIARGAIVDAHGADAYQKTQVLNNTDGIISGVIANPGGYAQAKVALDAAIAGAPPHLQPALAAEAHDKLSQGYVEGLIDNGQVDVAQSVLKDGSLNLKPEVQASLMARAAAAEQDHRPRTVQQATDQLNLTQRGDANVVALATTGRVAADGPAVDQMAASLGVEKAALYQAQTTAAANAYATNGSVKAASVAELHQMAATPLPDPSDPKYSTDLPVAQATRKAASDELAARVANPGQWAWSTGPKVGPGKNGAPGATKPGDYNNAIPGLYQAISAAPTPQARAQAATIYADRMLGHQESAGIDKTAWQIVPGQEASRLASAMSSAAPEQRLGAYQQVAQLVDAMPTSVKAQDGSIVSPRALLARQLQNAGASLTDVSALADYGADPQRLGRYVAAVNDPNAAKPLDKNDEKTLDTAVMGALKPTLQARSALPGEDLLWQARVDRTTLVARYLVQTQNMAPAAAARTAAGDLTQGETIVGGQRIPSPVANASVSGNFSQSMGPGWRQLNGATAIQAGQRQVVSDLVANNGAKLFAPSALPGAPDEQRAQLALQVQKAGKWVTSADGSTTTLMVPGRTGAYIPVADRFGNPIQGNWNAIQTQANQGSAPLFGNPGPGTPHTPQGQPVAAMSPARGQQLFQQALVGTESNGRNGAFSPKGALGRWQVMPDTATPYAARLFGAPLDTDRLQNDPAYNATIGQAVLSHVWSQFGGDPVLAAVAYNGGPGVLTGYVKNGVRHPGLLATIGDPRTGALSHSQFLARMPPGETRDYVGKLAQRFMALANGG